MWSLSYTYDWSPYDRWTLSGVRPTESADWSYVVMVWFFFCDRCMLIDWNPPSVGNHSVCGCIHASWVWLSWGWPSCCVLYGLFPNFVFVLYSFTFENGCWRMMWSVQSGTVPERTSTILWKQAMGFSGRAFYQLFGESRKLDDNQELRETSHHRSDRVTDDAQLTYCSRPTTTTTHHQLTAHTLKSQTTNYRPGRNFTKIDVTTVPPHMEHHSE